ncbi:BRCA-2 OB1 and BRCA-2 OB3 domain containing prote in [Trichuris trichiura]|uniref:BRCA-2 OB1 and BRCA-2 OB3 domain containing prote in n=1 Tax=Trichuris trichiura TaxID=36087 RepID=A0A077YX13_TRITR|nr:BRCA-2 OB1 and BRCA-2 OB3 domain containing prote in [Trichuris trichiura]
MSDLVDAGPGVSTSDFQTAFGQTCTISSQALASARLSFYQLAENSIALEESQAFSSEAIQHVDSTTQCSDGESVTMRCGPSIENLNPNDSLGSAICGFNTAAGNRCSISSDAMVKAKLLFDRSCNDELVQDHADVCGFRTAAGSSLSIEQDALKKAESTFNTLNATVVQESAQAADINGYKTPSIIRTPLSSFPGSSRSLGILKHLRPFETPSAKYRPPLGFASQKGDSTPKFLYRKRKAIAENLNTAFDSLSAKQATLGSVGLSSSAGRLFNLRSRGRFIQLRKFFSQDERSYLSVEQLVALGVHHSVINVCCKNAKNFVFDSSMLNSPPGSTLLAGDGVYVQVDLCVLLKIQPPSKRGFCQADGPAIITDGSCGNWLPTNFDVNAYDLVYRCLTVDRVLLELRYRYDREIERAHRPAIRKIFNCDLSAAVPLVLCLSDVKNADEKASCVTVEVTDGWYSMNAVLDVKLSQFLRRGLLWVGQKLYVIGAMLHGCDDACEPWDAPGNVRLSLSVNGVRQARWYAKLGQQSLRIKPVFPLASLYPRGGFVFLTDLLIHRIYPPVFLERLRDHPGNLRNEASQMTHFRIFEEQFSKSVENALDSVIKEFEADTFGMDTSTTGSRRKPALDYDTQQIQAVDDVEGLIKMYKSTSDPQRFERSIMLTQRRNLQKYQNRLNELQWAELQKIVEKKISELKKNRLLCSVVPILKLRVSDCHAVSTTQSSDYILNIWRADVEELSHRLQEGKAYRVHNLKMSHFGTETTCLNTTVGTKIQELSPKYYNASQAGFMSRRLTTFDELRSSEFVSPSDEVDIVGFIIAVATNDGGDTVYLADEGKNVIALKIGDGIKNYCWEGVLKTGNVVACQNLVHKRLVNARIPQLEATLLSSVKQNPREHHISSAVALFKKHIQVCA